MAIKFGLHKLEDHILSMCIDLFGDSAKLKVSIPKYVFGHLSINAPLVYGAQVSHDELLDKFKANLDSSYVRDCELKSGFINFWLTDECIQMLGSECVLAKGKFKSTNSQKINLEYISANPTGALHVGHLRGVYCDALARFLRFRGHDVECDYYVNNVGHQIQVLAESVMYQYSQLHGLNYLEPVEMYPGEYIKTIAAKVACNELDKAYFMNFSVQENLEIIKDELALFGIGYDTWRFESDIIKEGLTEEAVSILKDKGYAQYGVLGEIRSGKGSASNREILIFRRNPEDEGKALTSQDGSYTYFADDLGYYLDKVKRGFKTIIMSLGGDHIGHAQALEKAVECLDFGVPINFIILQTVHFVRRGDKVKFSKRAGEVLSPKDIAKECEPHLVIFTLLTKSPNTQMTINLDEISNISEDNPFYYLKYAYQRSLSLIKDNAIGSISIANYTKDMIELLYKLVQWEHELRIIEKNLHVHRIIEYLTQTAQLFHSIWNQGRSNPEHRWIIEDNAKRTQDRLALVNLFKIILESGLSIIFSKLDMLCD